MYSTGQQKYNKKKTFSYVCPECFERCDLTFNMNITLTDCSALENEFHFDGLNNRVFCKNCGSLMFNCDSRIVNDIIALNKNGIKTAYCCQGHKVEPFISRNFSMSIENKYVRNYDISNMSSISRPYIMFNLDDVFYYNKVIDDSSPEFENTDPPVVYFADALLMAICQSGSKEFPKEFMFKSHVNEFAKNYIPFTYEIIITGNDEECAIIEYKHKLYDFIADIKKYCFDIDNFSEERHISIVIANDNYQNGKSYDKILLEKHDLGDKYIISLIKNLSDIANYLNWIDPDELIPSKFGTNPTSILSIVRRIAGMQTKIVKCRQHNIYVFDDFAIIFSRKYNAAYMLAKDISSDTVAGKVYNALYGIPRYFVGYTPYDINNLSQDTLTRLIYHDLDIMKKIMYERSGRLIW